MEENKNILDHLEVKKVSSPDPSYFANIAENIISQQKTKVIPLYKKPIIWTAAAAAIVFVVLMLIPSNDSIETSNVLLALNDIPTAEIEAYIDENIDDFDEDLLAEFVPEENLVIDPMFLEVETNSIEPDPAITLDDINLNDILEYIEKEGIDEEDFDEESFI